MGDWYGMAGIFVSHGPMFSIWDIYQKIAANHKSDKLKSPPFRRRYFQMHFLEWKYMNFD